MDILYDVVGYEGLYKINKNGEVLICKLNRLMSPVFRGKDNRPSVQLSKNSNRKGYYIHKLLAEHFIPNPENLPFIDHTREMNQNTQNSVRAFYVIIR